MDLAAVILERMPTVGLVLMRISGIIAVAPPFAATTVPVTLRGLLALVLTLIVVPAAPVWEGAGPWEFAAAAAGSSWWAWRWGSSSSWCCWRSREPAS